MSLGQEGRQGSQSYHEVGSSLFFCHTVRLSARTGIVFGLEGRKGPQGAMWYTIAHFDILAILYCVFLSLCLMVCLSVSPNNHTDV